MPDASDLNTLTIGIFAGAFLVVLLVAFALSGNRGQVAVQRRVGRVSGQAVAKSRPSATVSLRRSDIARTGDRGPSRLIERLVPNYTALVETLERTGRPITVAKFVLYSVGLGAFVIIVAALLLKLSPLISLGIGIVVALIVPRVIVKRMAKKRLGRFITLFPDAIDLMVRSLRVGTPISEAIALTARDLQDPVGPEFARVANGMSLGRTLDEGLWDMAARLNIPEFSFFVTSLSVQRETGGNLAETLESLSKLLRDRHAMKKKIKALSAEARASAWIVGLLPFVMFLVIYLVNPKYIEGLIGDNRGLILIGVGLTSQAIGVGIMAKMSQFEI
jgi:tight adherence protein B